MLNEMYAALSFAAQATPLVVLIATDNFCGAIILRNSRSTPEQLMVGTNVDVKLLTRLTHSIRSCTRHVSRSSAQTRVMKSDSPHQASFCAILKTLWHEVVEIIVKALGFQVRLTQGTEKT